MSILQIELSDKERDALELLAKDSGKSPQSIVKEALEDLLHDAASFDWKAAIMQGAGIWKDREDLPDFDEIRRSLDRDPWSR
jgi:predicted transcriptional regulator